MNKMATMTGNVFGTGNMYTMIFMNEPNYSVSDELLLCEWLSLSYLI